MMIKVFLCSILLLATGYQVSAQRTTIAGALGRSRRFSTLYAAAVKAGLGDVLSNPALKVTVLAPDNAAFERFATANNLNLTEVSAETLASILSYHVIPEAKNVDYLKRRPTWATLFSGHTLNVTASRYYTYVVDEAGNTRRLSPVNQRLGKSYLHVVSDVLVPNGVLSAPTASPPPPAAATTPGPFDTIAAALAAVPDLSTLLAAAGASALLPAAQDPATVATIFAPVNEAFPAALAYYQLSAADQLIGNTAQLNSLLNNHVVLGAAVQSTQITDGQTFPSAASTTLTATLRDGSVFIRGPINEVKVITANVVAGAAIVHVVDGVILI